MKGQLTSAQTQKLKLKKYDAHSLSPFPNPNINQEPPIICSNKTMMMISLPQMRKSSRCGSLKNDEI